DDLVTETLRTGRPSNRDRTGTLLSAAPLLVHERVAGAVRAARSDAAAAARTHRAWLRLLGLGLAVVAVAGLAAWWLGRPLAAPRARRGRPPAGDDRRAARGRARRAARPRADRPRRLPGRGRRGVAAPAGRAGPPAASPRRPGHRRGRIARRRPPDPRRADRE